MCPCVRACVRATIPISIIPPDYPSVDNPPCRPPSPSPPPACAATASSRWFSATGSGRTPRRSMICGAARCTQFMICAVYGLLGSGHKQLRRSMICGAARCAASRRARTRADTQRRAGPHPSKHPLTRTTQTRKPALAHAHTHTHTHTHTSSRASASRQVASPRPAQAAMTSIQQPGSNRLDDTIIIIIIINNNNNNNNKDNNNNNNNNNNKQ